MNTSRAYLRQEIAARIPGTLTRRARSVYFATADRACDIYAELDRTADSDDRARVLGELAALDGAMAGQYGTGWQTTDEDRAIVTAYRDASILLDLLASTEAVTHEASRELAPRDWEDAFGTVLDDLANEDDIHRRAELMTRLYLASYDVLGGDAAETVARVADACIRIALHSAGSLPVIDQAGAHTDETATGAEVPQELTGLYAQVTSANGNHAYYRDLFNKAAQTPDDAVPED